MAIAALALAVTDSISGEYSRADYLGAAERAFAFLEAENPRMTNDGTENIVDDYCALNAATELYKATGKEIYRKAAAGRAGKLIGRLASWQKYTDYWVADNGDRPFFHPADAGLPLVSLLNYYPYAGPAMQPVIKEAIHRSLVSELRLTREVNNPFG